MLLTEFWRRRIKGARPPESIYVPPEEFSAMVEEHNCVREQHGQPRIRVNLAREIRIHGVIVKRLELLERRGRKEKEGR